MVSRPESTSIDKNKQHCHYRQRHPTKADSKAVAACRPRARMGSNRSIRRAQTPIDVDMVATSRGLIASGLLGTTSLKRCGMTIYLLSRQSSPYRQRFLCLVCYASRHFLGCHRLTWFYCQLHVSNASIIFSKSQLTGAAACSWRVSKLV